MIRSILISLFLICFLACQVHSPVGKIVDKKHTDTHTITVCHMIYFGNTPILMPSTQIIPENFEFIIECTICGTTQSLSVSKDSYDIYKIGDIYSN